MHDGTFPTFSDITKVEGPLVRHVEALWAEIHTLQDRVKELEKQVKQSNQE